jgi:hypothetical protein
MGRNLETHDFYCIQCGKRGIPVVRNKGQQRDKHHLKKLFCLTCQMEINHVECKNYAEVIEFKEKFEKGEFIDAAQESISYVRDSGFRKDNLG